MKNLTNTMLCWTPTTDKVALIPWPDRKNLSNKYINTGLACFSFIREMGFEERKAIIFIEFAHLVIRDGCCPKAVHKALLGLKEYRDGCANDMPGINRI